MEQGFAGLIIRVMLEMGEELIGYSKDPLVGGLSSLKEFVTAWKCIIHFALYLVYFVQAGVLFKFPE